MNTRRLLASAWALSLVVPGVAAGAVYARYPRALVRPLDLALLASWAAASLWGGALATWLVGRLSRAHAVILEAAARAAVREDRAPLAGLGASARSDELVRAIDAMLSALDRLTTSQQHFVTHAAHGLRRPALELLDELTALSRGEAVGADGLARAWEGAQRLGLLADDLLALDRVGVGVHDAVGLSLREVALAAMEPLRASARTRGVALGVDGDGQARGRASDLQRLVRHLLENAVRHSPSGAPVRVIIRDDPPFVTLRVRDQGPGVAAALRAHVFEPFARGEGAPDDEDPGAGLGLAIVREIARAHGGDVSLEAPDRERRGATFAVRLPRA